MSSYLLGVDSGGTMTKAALFTTDGREVAAEYRPVAMSFPGAGFTERDPLAMWTATCESIGSVIHSAGIDPGDILAVCATGYGSGLYCIDSVGEPTCPGVVSTDSRAGDVILDWRARGLDTLARQTLAQDFWPAQSLTLLGWLQRHRPEIMQRTSTILECKDYIRFRLCGERSTDVTDAAVGGLLDMQTGGYATSLMSALELDGWIDKLPSLSTPEARAGEVTAVASKATGLAVGTPVMCGAVDIVCSAIASGVVDASQLSVVAGTWSINNALRKAQPQTAPVPFLQMPYLTPDTFLACEASATSASNLEWCCNHVFDAERLLGAAEGESIYDRCGQMVASRHEAPSDLMFLPYLYGGPNNEPAGFIGMQARHERADLVYAVYEGIVFAHKRHVDQLLAAGQAADQAAVDRPVESLRLAGGAARSDIWAQLFADVLGLTVEVADSTEFGALGACICASVGVGCHADYHEAVSRMVRVDKRFTPNAALQERSAERYARFCRTGTALAALH